MKLPDIVRKGKEKGSALTVALIGLAVGALLIGAFLTMADSSLRISKSYDFAADRQYAAEAGMEYAIWGLQTRSISLANDDHAISDSGLQINDCTVDVSISLQDIDLVNPGTQQPKNKSVYQVVSTATDPNGKHTTITTSIVTVYDMFAYAITSLDGNITISGNVAEGGFCWGTDPNDPNIFSDPNTTEADIYANNGNIVINDRTAWPQANPLVRGEAYATGTITDPRNRITQGKTQNVVQNLPALLEQQQLMDEAIVEWKEEATLSAPGTPTMPSIDPINTTCLGDSCEGTVYGATHISGGTHVYNGAVCFTGNLTIDLFATVDFNGPVYVNGNVTISAAWVDFHDTVYITGDLSMSGAIGVFGQEDTDTLCVGGDITMTAVLGFNVNYDFNGPVSVGGSMIMNAAAIANIITDFFSTVEIGGNLTMSGVAFAGITANFGNDVTDTVTVGQNLTVSTAGAAADVDFQGSVDVTGNVTLGGGACVVDTNFHETVIIGGDLDCSAMLGGTLLTFGDDKETDSVYVEGNSTFMGGFIGGTGTVVNGDFWGKGNMTLGGGGIGIGNVEFHGSVYNEGNIATSGGLAAAFTLTFGDDEDDTFYCGGNVSLTGTIAVGSTLEWASDVYVEGSFTLGNILAASGVTIPESFYAGGNVSVSGVGASAALNFGDESGDTFYCGGDVSVSGVIAGADVNFWDIAYAEGNISFNGAITNDHFVVHRMLIAEGNITLNSNSNSPTVEAEFIPLFISSGSATGTGNITIRDKYDTPGVFYAPTGTITVTGNGSDMDVDIYGCLIGKSVNWQDPACNWFTGSSSLEFPEDIRFRANDLPGRASGDQSTDIHTWHITEW